MSSYKYMILEMREIYSEQDCKDETDRRAFRTAVEFGEPISIGESVAIPPNWKPAHMRKSK